MSSITNRKEKVNSEKNGKKTELFFFVDFYKIMCYNKIDKD